MKAPGWHLQPPTWRLTLWAPCRCLSDVGSLAFSSQVEMLQVFWGCCSVSGLLPKAPAQGKQTLSQNLMELRPPHPPAWKLSAENVGNRASSGENEAAQPRAVASPGGWSPVCLQ